MKKLEKNFTFFATKMKNPRLCNEIWCCEL